MNALKRYTRTIFCSVGLFVTALVAGCGGGDQGRDPILGLPAASLVSVSVTPAAPTLRPGLTLQFSATAIYSDASTRDVTASSTWTSATAAVATINPATGLATTVAVGTSAIGASFGGRNGAATLTVANPSVLSLAVSPQAPTLVAGTSRQLTAVATYADGSAGDVTASTSFAASAATVSSTTGGLVTGVSAGTAIMTGTFSGKSATTTVTVTAPAVQSLAITPQAPSLQVGASRQLAAIATFSDGTSGDVSSATVFSSAASSVAASTAKGLVSGVSAGSAVITGAYGGKSGTTTATVTAATIASIAVTPNPANIVSGAQQQFVAIATYTDASTAVITNSALWSSSVPAVATIVPASGLATGAAVGTTIVTASLTGKSGTATLNVLAAPPVVTLNPVNLRSVATFGVLAGTSITNNAGGTTLVTGDIGAPSQTVDPTQAAGYNNYKSGAVLTDALADLQLAIIDANGRACTVNFAGAVDLGGQVLTPGVYCATGAINITGTLTLSGTGVYIFRTAGTLNSTANSIVALTNGASYDNLSWVPVGPTTLGANSVFKGTLLGQSAAITLGDNANLQNGRVLTAAAVTLANNKITK
ncbi:MAG: ice-binding family protein [Massilia sp.]